MGKIFIFDEQFQIDSFFFNFNSLQISAKELFFMLLNMKCFSFVIIGMEQGVASDYVYTEWNLFEFAHKYTNEFKIVDLLK